MKLLLSLLLILLSQIGFPQPLRFNKNYDYYPYPASCNVIEKNKIYYSIGSTATLGGLGKVTITAIDSIGNEIWNKSYGDTTHTWYLDGLYTLAKVNSNGYFLGTAKEDIYGKKEILLIRFDNNFDTLWTKSYLKDSVYTSGNGCMFGADGNFYIIGTKLTALHTESMLLLKTDTNGNLISTKYYGQGDYWLKTGFKIINTNDKGFLLGGWLGYYNYAYAGDWCLLRTDSTGAQQNQWTFGTNRNDGGVVGLINTKDSGYIMTGAIYRTSWGSDDLYNGRLIKLNKNFEVVFDKQYPTSNYNGWLNSIVELENGDLAVGFISIDTLGDISNTRYGSGLMKLDAAGNILWKRTYFPFNGDSTINAEGFLWALSLTSDNGFILSGYAHGDFQTPNQQAWVVKTDSMGCDGVCYCDTVTQVETDHFDKLSVHLDVYPNPAREFVTVGTINSIQGATIIIADLLGRTIYEECVQPNTNYSKILVKDFPEGVYIVKVQGKGFVGMDKFLKW